MADWEVDRDGQLDSSPSSATDCMEGKSGTLKECRRVAFSLNFDDVNRDSGTLGTLSVLATSEFFGGIGKAQGRNRSCR